MESLKQSGMTDLADHLQTAVDNFHNKLQSVQADAKKVMDDQVRTTPSSLCLPCTKKVMDD